MLRFVDGHTWSEMTLLVSRGIWMMDLDESMGSLLGGDIAGLFWFGYRQGLVKPDLGLVFLLARWIFCFFSPTRACVKQCIASCLKSRTMSMTLCLEHDAPEAISPFSTSGAILGETWTISVLASGRSSCGRVFSISLLRRTSARYCCQTSYLEA